MSQDPRILFSIASALAGLLAAIWIYLRIRRAGRHRKERLAEIRRFDAIRTSSPLDHPMETAQRQGAESIEARFTLIRRAAIPLALGLGLICTALPWIGRVPTTILTVMMAAVTVLIGIVAKPPLENLFSGLLISFSKPIRIGDTVLIDDLFGTVEDISFTHTTIKLWDWRRLLIPNSRMVGKEFINYSIVDRYQWAFVDFWVAPDAILTRVEEIAVSVPARSAAFADHEPPKFWVMALGKEGTHCRVAAWADTPSGAWQLGSDIRIQLAVELNKAGIKTHGYVLQQEPPAAG